MLENRYEATKNIGEFGKRHLDLMQIENARLDENGNPYELHHVDPQKNGNIDVNNPINFREVTCRQPTAMDPFSNL